MSFPRAQTQEAKPRGPRRETGQAARGAALLLLVSLIAGGASAGVAEAIARMAVATGVEQALARQPLACAQGLALGSASWSARTAEAATQGAQRTRLRDERGLRSLLGALTLCDLPPPLA